MISLLVGSLSVIEDVVILKKKHLERNLSVCTGCLNFIDYIIVHDAIMKEYVRLEKTFSGLMIE